MTIVEFIEGGRLFGNFLKTPQRRGCPIPPDQQGNPGDVWNIFEQIEEPDLADETSHANEQDVPTSQRFTNGKATGPRLFPEGRDGFAVRRRGARGGLHGGFEPLRGVPPAKLRKKFFLRDAVVGRPAGQPRKGTPRAHDGIEEPSSRIPVTKFQTVGDERFHAKVFRKRPQNMFQGLPDENNAFAAANSVNQFFGGFPAELRLQNVVKIFFTKQIKAVAAGPAKKRMQKPCGKSAICGVGRQPRERHRRHTCAARPTLGETLRVPSEKTDGAQRAHLEQRPFNAPVGHIPRLGCRNTLRIGV